MTDEAFDYFITCLIISAFVAAVCKAYLLACLLLGAIVLVVFVCLATHYVRYGCSREEFTESIGRLRGTLEVNSANEIYGANITVDYRRQDYPVMELSFDTFMTLFSADSTKFAFFLSNTDCTCPGAILYDRDKDGTPDIRVTMKTDDDAVELLQWFRKKRLEEQEKEQTLKDEAAYEELIACTEQMQQDIKKKRDRDHQTIMQMTEKNKKWRKDAEERGKQMRGGV